MLKTANAQQRMGAGSRCYLCVMTVCYHMTPPLSSVCHYCLSVIIGPLHCHLCVMTVTVCYHRTPTLLSVCDDCLCVIIGPYTVICV